MEGMATQRNFFKNTTLTERVCSLCSNSHSLTYCMAVENVLGMTPPPRAQYLRVLAEETKRVASHLFNIAISRTTWASSPCSCTSWKCARTCRT